MMKQCETHCNSFLHNGYKRADAGRGADLEMTTHVWGKRRIVVTYPHQNADGSKHFKGG